MIRTKHVLRIRCLLAFLFVAFLHVGFAEEKSIAVIPFENHSGDVSIDWLGKAVAETLTSKLVTAGLPLVERSSIASILQEINFSQRSDLVDQDKAVQVGKLHGAKILILGSFQKTGRHCRMNARLVNTETGEILNAVQRTGLIEGLGLFQLQDEIAFAILKAKGIPIIAYKTVNLIDPALYWEAVAAIKKNYIHEINLDTSSAPNIVGLLLQLDPRCDYMDVRAVKEMRKKNAGQYCGIGVVIQMREGVPTVVSPLEDSSAFNAGIKPLDRILAINGTPTIGLSLLNVVDTLRGIQGTPVTVQVQQAGSEELIDYSLIRTPLRVLSIRSPEMLNAVTGYIRINSFNANMPGELKEALKLLKRKGMKSLILDLRANPGGLLGSAVESAGFFLPGKSMIVVTKSRVPDHQYEIRSKKGGWVNIPIVILVDQGTASIAEIFCAALQENGRAVLMGERTFGRGTINIVNFFSDGSALSLTAAYYLTPESNPIETVGLQPDIPSDLKDEVLIQQAVEILSEHKTEGPDLDRPTENKLVMPK